MIILSSNNLFSSSGTITLPHASSSGMYCIVESLSGLASNLFYLSINGKLLLPCDNSIIYDGNVCVVPRLFGGKGGFGSMLRAIGAQIEKTTNREACRDLSGRRLRDINEEQRLKTWIAQQSEREKEIEEKRKKKLEKLSAEPKHNFKDEKYDLERTTMTERLFESIEQGISASKNVSLKREKPEPVSKQPPPKKVKKFLMCSDEELSSSDESDVSPEESSHGPVTDMKAIPKKLSDDIKC